MTGDVAGTPRPIADWTPGPAKDWIEGTPLGDPLPWFTIYCDDESGWSQPGTHKGNARRYIVLSLERDMAGNWHSATPSERSRGTSQRTDAGRQTYYSRDGQTYGYAREHTGDELAGWKFELRCRPCRGKGLPNGVRHDTLKPILDALVLAGASEISLRAVIARIRSTRG